MAKSRASAGRPVRRHPAPVQPGAQPGEDLRHIPYPVIAAQGPRNARRDAGELIGAEFAPRDRDPAAGGALPAGGRTAADQLRHRRQPTSRSPRLDSRPGAQHPDQFIITGHTPVRPRCRISGFRPAPGLAARYPRLLRRRILNGAPHWNGWDRDGRTGRRTGPTAGQEPCIQLGQRRIKLRRRRIGAGTRAFPRPARHPGRKIEFAVPGLAVVEIVRVDQAVRASGFHLGHERRQRRLLIPVVIDATQPRRGLLLVRPRRGGSGGLGTARNLRAASGPAAPG